MPNTETSCPSPAQLAGVTVAPLLIVAGVLLGVALCAGTWASLLLVGVSLAVMALAALVDAAARLPQEGAFGAGLDSERPGELVPCVICRSAPALATSEACAGCLGAMGLDVATVQQLDQLSRRPA